MRPLHFITPLILLCLSCGGETTTPGPPFSRPGVEPGTVLRRSLDETTGYRTVLKGEPGPGLLLTFPPVEYATLPYQCVRLAGRVDAGVELHVNGEPARVYPTGSFLALVPLVDGANTILITARDRRGITEYPLEIRREKPESREDKSSEFKRSRSGRVTESHTPIQLLPGRTRLFTPERGAVLTVTGRNGKYLRVDLGGGLTGWVRADNVELGGDGPDGPFRAGNVEVDPARAQVHFSLETSVPARVEYVSPSELTVIFYNTVVDTRTINLGDWEGNCWWSQDRDGQAVFHLQGELDCHRWLLTRDDGGYLLHWDGHPGRQKKAVLCIDPGHGGEQWGAVSPSGISEKEANLKLAALVAEGLEKEGIETVLSRKDDRLVDLYQRIEPARNAGAGLLLSLHYNSVGEDRDPLSRSGCTVFYYNPPARELAGDIYRSLKETGLTGGGVRRRSLAVIRPTDLVAVLVEVAFLSHPSDEAKVIDPEFRKKTADAIVKGVLEYLQ